MKQSIARRMAGLFTMTTLFVVMLISAGLYHILTVQMAGYQQRELAAALHDRAYQIERIDRIDRWERVDRKMAVLTPPDGGMRYWVLSDDPRFRFGTDLDALGVQRATSGRMDLVRVPGRAYPFHVLARHFDANGQRPAVTLVVGIDTQPFMEARRMFGMALGVLCATAAVAVYALGHAVARLGLQPLQQLSDQAGELSAARLSQRLLMSPLPRELAGLTGAFNAALDRLEQAYRQLGAFNADVAHELRTPLGNLIGLTQVALARPRSAVDLEEVLQSNLEELERLRSIVNDMLFLARADHGECPATLVGTCVADEIGKAVEFLELVLEEAGKTVRIEGDLGACAPLDPALFRRALVNLLHNAVLYSSAGAHLAVRIHERDADIAIEVVNPGDTIAPDHLRRLFDRFYRIDHARHASRGQQGHGLGLAIVKAIARMHGGTEFASSAAGVTVIGFTVAAAPPSPAPACRRPCFATRKPQ